MAFLRNDYMLDIIIITTGKVAMITLMVIATKKKLLAMPKKPQALFTATIITTMTIRYQSLLPK